MVGNDGITKPKEKKDKNKKDKGNGKSKDKRTANIDLDVVEKSQMEKDLEIVQSNILKLEKRWNEAYTDTEKEFISFTIRSLEQNQIRMLKYFEQRFHKEPVLTIEDENNTLPLTEISKEYPGLKYNVDDPSIRKLIGRGLSYDSGYSGYTQKEARELVELLDLSD